MVTTKADFGYAVPHEPEGSDDLTVTYQPPPVALRLEGDVRVTMLVKVSGTRDGADWPDIGEDIVLPAAEAVPLIRSNSARPAPEPVERAVADEPAPERAVVPTPVKRRSRRDG